MKKNIITWFKNISIKSKLYYVTGIMFLLITLELFTLYSMVYILSATRAYVGGEGLWSKAQKDSTVYLLKYANSRDENDYQKFLNFASVNLGDTKARLELLKPHPNFNIVTQGFIEGRNIPADIPGMINFFRWFHRVYYLKKAILLWTEADKQIAILHNIGKNLHQEISNGTFTEAEHAATVNQIYQINAVITVLADDFSYVLGEASRWVESIVLTTILSIAITVEISGLLLIILITSNIRKGIDSITKVAKKITQLDFAERAARYSDDEIGQLASAFNQMITDLERSIQRVTSLSRMAGMAEVASGVLHNVGNTLNSINISVELMHNKILHSRMDSLVELATLLQQHKDDVETFLVHNPRGQNIPQFLTLLSDAWLQEKKFCLQESDSLMKNVAHIKSIIMMQQSLSYTAGLTEKVVVADLLEDAIIMNKLAYEHANIKIVRDFSPIKPVIIDKIKLFQIMVNLIKNSIDALVENNNLTSQLLLRILEKDASHFMIQISDNGIGISPENITKIFSQGFTTKKTGHGFGLHTSSLYAKDLGGNLYAESEGIGHGATFTLILPINPNINVPQ